MSKTISHEVLDFYGHLGVLLPDAVHTAWFPISRIVATSVRRQIAACRDSYAWITAETLNNRFIVFRPDRVKRIWLLDDASDGPPGDFVSSTAIDDHAGLPRPIYEATANWSDGEDMKAGKCSTIGNAAMQLIARAGFERREFELRKILRFTTIHFLDGTSTSYEANRQNLIDSITAFEDNDKIVEISHAEDDFESFYATDMLRMVDISLLELDLSLLPNNKVMPVSKNPTKMRNGRLGWNFVIRP